METSSFLTVKDLEELLNVLEVDNSPDTLTRISKFMLCIYIAESGCDYKVVQDCVMQLKSSDVRIGLENMQLDFWTKVLNVTTTGLSSHIVNALPGFFEEHVDLTNTPIDFNIIVNSAVSSTLPVTIGMSAFILHIWWNIKGLHTHAARYCRNYISALHSKWSLLEKQKKEAFKDMMKVLSSIPLGTSLSQQVEKLMVLLMLQDDLEDLACNLTCVESLITANNGNDIESHIEALCNIIQSHAKGGIRNIAYSTAQRRLRETAATKGRFSQRPFLACSPGKVKSACTSLLTFVSYAWKGLKKVHPTTECLLYVQAIADQWSEVTSLKRKAEARRTQEPQANRRCLNVEDRNKNNNLVFELTPIEISRGDPDEDGPGTSHRQHRRPRQLCEANVLERAVEKFKRDCVPITSFCSCCKQIKQEVELSELHDAIMTGMVEGGRNDFVQELLPHRHGPLSSFKFCRPCTTKLKKDYDWKPPQLPFNTIHPAILKCNKLEAALLAAVVGFHRIVTLPSTRQKGVKGHVISVPNSGQKLETTLPNDFRPTVFYRCQMLRRLSDRHTFKDGYIRPDVMISAAEALLQTPLYQGFIFDADKLRQLAADFPEVVTEDDENTDMDVPTFEANTHDHDNGSPTNNEGVDELAMLQIDEQRGQAPDHHTCLYEDGISHFMDHVSNLMVPPVPQQGHDEYESQRRPETIRDVEDNRSESGIMETYLNGDGNENITDLHGPGLAGPGIAEAPETDTLPTEHRVLQESVMRIAPGEGNRPIYCWQDDDLQAKMFPQEFGGFPQQNPECLSRHEMYKLKMLSIDRRFARNPEIIFYLQREAMIYSVFQCAKMSLKKGSDPERLTAAQARDPEFIKKAIQQRKGTLHMQNLRTSPDYMKSTQHDFMAMFRTIGIPTFFVTVSCADTKWEQFLQTLYFLKHGRLATPTELEAMSFDEKCELLGSDPIVTAMCYRKRVESLFNNVIDKTKILGTITDRLHVEEAQKRGTPHRHSLLYEATAPKFNPKDPDKDAAIEDFCDKYITTDVDVLEPELQCLQQHTCCRGKCLKKNGECRFAAPWFPMEKSRVLRRPLLQPDEEEKAMNDLHRIQAEMKRIDVILQGKNGESIDFTGAMRMDFPSFLAACQVTQAEYETAVSLSMKEDAKVFYKRKVQHMRINTFNEQLTRIWRANTDVQFVLDPYACVQYVTGYMLKGDRALTKAMQDIIRAAELDGDVEAAIRRGGFLFINMHEISVQMAAYHLLQYPLRFMSRAVLFLNTNRPEERAVVLKPQSKLNEMDPDSPYVFADSMHRHFRQFVQYRRVSNDPDICLADFCSMYGDLKKVQSKKPCVTAREIYIPECEEEQTDNSEDGELEHQGHEDSGMADHTFNAECPRKRILQSAGYQRSLRRKPRILRFPPAVKSDYREEQCRVLLLLYAPGSVWATQAEKDEDTALLGGYATYSAHYEAIQDRIQETAMKYNTHSHIDWEALIAQHENEYDDDIPLDLDEAGEVQDMMTLPNLPTPASEDLQIPVIATSSETSWKLWDTKEWHTEAALLTGEQRRAVQYAVCHVLYHAWNIIVDPLLLFITGGAGTGKSCTVSFMRQALDRVLPRNIDDDGHGILIQVAAQNGKAAWLVQGKTLHSAMGWAVGREGKPGTVRMQELIAEYKNTAVFILDEVSQISSNNLSHLNNNLQEYSNDFTKLFGNKHIIATGDAFQLEAILMPNFYEVPRVKARGIPPGETLWDKFGMLELTHVLRFGGWMVPALNRMRVGEHTPDDIAKFKSCERDPPMDIPLHCCTNERVVQHNKRVYQILATQPVCFIALPVRTGSSNFAFQRRMEEARNVRENYTTEMFKRGTLFCLYLKVGMIVEYTINNKAGDGLVNGADGVLKAFTTTCGKREFDDTPVADVAWVEFSDPRVGAIRRKRQASYIAQNNTTYIAPTWTPITRELVTMRKGQTPSDVVMMQVPLMPANARTHDRSQGMTMDDSGVDLFQKPRHPNRPGLHYMALSRSRTPEGLFIVPGSFDPSRITVSEKAKNAMAKMRATQSIVFPHPQQPTKHELNFVYHNASSLRAHSSVAASWLTMPEIKDGDSPVHFVFVSESCCTIADIAEVVAHFPEFVCTAYVNHNNLHPRNKAGSMMLTNMKLVRDIPNVSSHSGAGLEILMVDFTTDTPFRFIHVYRSPSHSNIPTMLSILEPMLSHTCWVVMGDLNINMADVQHTQTCMLNNFFQSHQGTLLNKTPTTLYNSLLDHIWTNCEQLIPTYGSMYTPYSDHFLLWGTLFPS